MCSSRILSFHVGFREARWPVSCFRLDPDVQCTASSSKSLEKEIRIEMPRPHHHAAPAVRSLPSSARIPASGVRLHLKVGLNTNSRAFHSIPIYYIYVYIHTIYILYKYYIDLICCIYNDKYIIFDVAKDDMLYLLYYIRYPTYWHLVHYLIRMKASS